MAQVKRADAMEIEGPVRGRRSRDEGMALVEQWRESGLRPAEFCRSRGIAEHRLHYWKRRAQPCESGAGSATSEFFAVLAPADDAREARKLAGAAPESIVEICLAGSLRVRVSLAAGRAAFVQTLRGVLEVVES
jgi:hypothetical protein